MYTNYISELKEIYERKNFLIERFAKTGKSGKYPLHKIILNQDSENGAVCFTAGIHGNEKSGPFGILDFLKKYNPEKEDPKIIVLPVLNPHGFCNNSCENHLDIDMNRHFFDAPLPKDIEKIYKNIENDKIDFFVALHEDDEKNGFYLYKYSKKEDPFHKIIDFLSRRGRICSEKEIYENKAKNGIISAPRHDGSFEEKMFYSGVSSACIEIPDNICLEKRINIVSELIYLIKNFDYDLQ